VYYGWASASWEQVAVDLSAYVSQSIYIRWSLLTENTRCEKFMFIDGVVTRTPVELSSFTASVAQMEGQDVVNLNWTTESETEVAGFNVLRNSSNNANSAMKLNNSLISGTNTSSTSDYTYTDSECETGTTFYWLQSNDLDGTVQTFGPISVKIDGSTQNKAPGFATELRNLYPNPFNVSTDNARIPFMVSAKSNVRLEVFNQKGQIVWSYEKSNADAGLYNVNWNGKDNNGRKLSSGVYFCKMTNGDYQGVRKIVVIK